MATVTEAHAQAIERLDEALAKQKRSTDRYEAAVGTAAELPADVDVHIAHEHVIAREAWLKWVDDEGYRGLNAGPFALRRELEDALGLIA
jgi:hypothetical protein